MNNFDAKSFHDAVLGNKLFSVPTMSKKGVDEVQADPTSQAVSPSPVRGRIWKNIQDSARSKIARLKATAEDRILLTGDAKKWVSNKNILAYLKNNIASVKTEDDLRLLETTLAALKSFGANPKVCQEIQRTIDQKLGEISHLKSNEAHKQEQTAQIYSEVERAVEPHVSNAVPASTVQPPPFRREVGEEQQNERQQSPQQPRPLVQASPQNLSSATVTQQQQPQAAQPSGATSSVTQQQQQQRVEVPQQNLPSPTPASSQQPLTAGEKLALALISLHEQADAGNMTAQLNLSEIYAEGTGVQKSEKDAAKYLKLAADQGNRTAQHQLANRYMEGKGVTKSLEEAAKYYKLAARAIGNDPGEKRAQLMLGWMYEHGKGVQQSNDAALEFYGKALSQNHSEAQKHINRLLGKLDNLE